MLLANCCSIVTCGPRAVGLVSVVRPWGSILMRLTPKSFCMRLLTVELIAWLMIRLVASSVKHALARLLLQLLRFLAGAAQREQRDDVRLGQRRLRAIVHIQAIGGSGHGDVEIVVANVRSGLQVDLGFDRDRIGKRNIAALQAELDAVEGRVAFQNVGAAQNAGTRNRAAQAQIGIAGEPRDRGLHLKFGRGADGDIQLHVVERRIGGRNRSRLAAALKI